MGLERTTTEFINKHSKQTMHKFEMCKILLLYPHEDLNCEPLVYDSIGLVDWVTTSHAIGLQFKPSREFSYINLEPDNIVIRNFAGSSIISTFNVAVKINK